MRHKKYIPLALLLASLAACQGSTDAPPTAASTDGRIGSEGVGARDRGCDLAAYPSQEWTACETANFARIGAAPLEALNPAFLARQTAQIAVNGQSLLARAADDPSWLDPRSGNSLLLPYCAPGAGPCSGDPFRYPEVEGPDGKVFYEQEAQVTPVVFYDRDCARISGQVWRPRGAEGRKLPGIVIENGSVGAGEQPYWWAAQALVRAGYMVLTHDPRGQGRSDFIAPGLMLGTNLDPRTFWLGLVDAIDFMHSTPARPYPWNADCAGTYPTAVTAFNPEHAVLDPERLGIAGHSFGAAGVSFVQSYGAPGAEPWPGRLDAQNPVDVIVAWDGLGNPASPVSPTASSFFPDEFGVLAGTVYVLTGEYPAIVPQVPALDFRTDYGLFSAPFPSPPDPELRKTSYHYWQAAGQPVAVINVAGTTHADFSNLPPLHSSSWCAEVIDNECVGSWGLGVFEHYTLAWFDRWLKQPGEAGYADADARLLDDGGEQGADKLSFRIRSARDFPDRAGRRHRCEDIRAGCPAASQAE